jgi:hypothetical protein
VIVDGVQRVFILGPGAAGGYLVDGVTCAMPDFLTDGAARRGVALREALRIRYDRYGRRGYTSARTRRAAPNTGGRR